MYALDNSFLIGGEGGNSGAYRWDNSRILLNSPKGTFSLDLIGNELSVDEFSFSVRYNPDTVGVALSPLGASDGKKLVLRAKPDGTERDPTPEPGTLEESGIARPEGYAVIHGNEISFTRQHGNNKVRLGTFKTGSVVELRVNITHLVLDSLGRGCTFTGWSNVSIESKTGLFEVKHSFDTVYYAEALEEGEDVLTFRPNGPGTFYLTCSAAYDSTFEITGMAINGQLLYGTVPLGRILLCKAYTGKEYLTDVAFGTPCWWSVDGTVMAKGYVKTIERTSRRSWQITCCSGVGLLDEKYHAGGIYDGAKARDVLASIIGSSFPYGITTGVGNTLIYGWLPYDTARANLHRLLFAIGASLTKGVNVDYNVVYLSESIKTVPSSRVALGGSVKLQLPATGVEVTEHSFSYLPDITEPVTLYDNSQGDTGVANHLTVVFPDPVEPESLTSTGSLTIEERDVNFAVVSGVGTLTGIPYIHNRTVVAVGDVSGSRVKRVTDNALVSAANSINVARRVLSYFQSAETISAKIQLSGEQPGNNLRLTDAWGEPVLAYLSKMTVSVTGVKAASCELVEGYFPGNNGNKFTHRVVITADGTWTVPEGVDVVRVVLIQGGSGGSGGQNGHDGWGGFPSEGDPLDGQLSRVYDYAEPPVYPVPGDHTIVEVRSYVYGADRQRGEPGGAAGIPGASGKILVTTQGVAEGDVLTFTVGAGGAGGASGGGFGAVGGETSVICSTAAEPWEASSADGAISEIGYHDTLGNVDLALPGEVGHDGGAGGTSDAQSTQFANSGAKGNNGKAVGQYAGGAGGKGVAVDGGWGFIGGTNDTASGGGGGGAAWGARGGAGGNARYIKTFISDEEPRFNIFSGAGGNGANAVAPAKPAYGCGGGGGNGGGSGGNVGGTLVFVWQSLEANAAQDFLGLRTNGYVPVYRYGGGLGGSGSAGGDGGDGVAIIYY